MFGADTKIGTPLRVADGGSNRQVPVGKFYHPVRFSFFGQGDAAFLPRFPHPWFTG